MTKRAAFMVEVAGTNITSALAPVLISLTVSDKVGTHSDTASLEIDDTDARIVFPQKGAGVMIAFGYVWAGLMFLTGAANLIIAVWFSAYWPLFLATFPTISKVALFAVQYLTVRHAAMRELAAGHAGAEQPMAETAPAPAA